MPVSAYKKPKPSLELQILHLLDSRMNFLEEDRLNYLNLCKGYEGEKKFAELLTKGLTTSCSTLYDLLLKSNNTVFQIDCLVEYQNKIYLFEVKNYEGDFYMNDENWYLITSSKEKRKEIRNPLLQLKRSEYLLRHLLHHLGFRIPIESYLIFVNKAFTLYQAPLHLPAIFPTQLNHFIKNLNTNPPTKNTELAKQLIALRIDQLPYNHLPEYSFDQLKKGITCTCCRGFLSYLNYKKLVCKNCGNEEDIEASVMRNVKELCLLFPDKKITTSIILHWCKIVESKKTIRRILHKNLTSIGYGKHSYFVFPSN